MTPQRSPMCSSPQLRGALILPWWCVSPGACTAVKSDRAPAAFDPRRLLLCASSDLTS